MYSQNTDCQPIVIDEEHFFYEDFSDYDALARLPMSSGTGVVPDCWERMSYQSPIISPKIVKGTTIGSLVSITLNSSCLQLRTSVSASGNTSYAVLPEIATDLSTLEVGFSTSSIVSDTSLQLSFGYLTDTTYESVDFVEVASFHNSYFPTDSFTRYEVQLNGIVFPENARLAFKVKYQYSIYYSQYVTAPQAIFIDDIVIRPIPSCRKPVDIELVAVSDTDATLQWQPSVADVPCRIEYGPVGFVQGTGTSFVVSSNSATLQSLSESTEYEVYIQTLCGENDSSEVARFHFQTACPSFMVDENHPYMEIFEDSTFGCWRQWEYDNVVWQADTNRLFSPMQGNGQTRRIVSPVFDCSTLYSAKCVFSYALSALNSNTELRLYYRIAATEPWTLLKTCREQSVTDTVVLPYLSEHYQISFVAEKENSEISLYDVSVIASDECVAPPRPRLLGVEESAAQIAWETFYAGAAVELEYGPTGFTVGTGVRENATSEEQDRWLTALLPNTAYDVYVRQECAGGVWSDWSLPLEFHTHCGPLTLSDSIIFTENFEVLQPGEFPNCWLRFHEGAGEQYFPHAYQGDYTPTEGGTAMLLTGTNLMSDLWEVGSQSGVALPFFSNPLSELEVSFTTAMSTTTGAHLEMGYLDDNEEFILIEEIPNNYYFSEERSVLHVLRLHDFGLPETVQGRIAFRWTVETNTRCYACLDDIRVRPVLECEYPLNVGVMETENMVYRVSWQPQDSTQDQWEVECAGNTYVVNADSCILTTLAPDADYFVRVRALCGESRSYWTDTLFFHTACGCVTATAAPFFEDFTHYQSTYNVYEMSDQPDCWSFLYNGYYQGFAPHIYNGSYALDNPALLLSLGVQGSTMGQELYAIFPPICENLEVLRVEFDVNLSRDTVASVMLLGYLTNRYDTTTFQMIDTVPHHFYTSAQSAHRRFDLHNYAPFPDHVHLAFKLISSDQTTHFYSVDNVKVCLLNDGIDEQDGDRNAAFTIYPNPTTGMVNVQFTMNNEQLGDGEIQVMDVYGRVLQVVGISDARISDARGSDARSASLQTVQIDLSRYATGVYIIKMVNNGRVMATGKVVRR